MAILIDDDDLTVEHMPGEGRRLVVAFTGIGHGHGGIQKAEFAGTASSGNSNHVAFVIDKRRSWFSVPGLRDRIVAALSDLRDRLGVEDVVTVGNSMGGYGAILFAAPLGARVAAGFVPQFSLSPDLVDERRWRQFRAGVVQDNHLPLSSGIAAGPSYYAIYGADEPADMRHADLMAACPEVRLFRLAGCGHDAVGMIKKAGLLPDLMAALIEDRANTVTVRLRRFERMTANAAKRRDRDTQRAANEDRPRRAAADDRTTRGARP